MVALDQWLSGAAGQYFLQWEQMRLDQLTPDIFGYRAVQLGSRLIDGLKESRIPHKAYLSQALVTPFSAQEGWLAPDCLVEYEDLPFASQSLDLIVMPHVLEFSSDPHQLLREVERVLMPEGKVIITGFNPMSLWGLRHWMFKRWSKVWPDGCSPLHLSRMKDWLKLLSLEPHYGRFGGYRFPSFNAGSLARYGFMEKAGDRWWPVCGGVYLICAVKRVRGMRLVGPDFKRRAISVKQLKPATNQIGHPMSNKFSTIDDSSNQG